jgi:colicin import membrane protein
LGLEISKALSDTLHETGGGGGALSAVREAVNLERAELERLHKIDMAATALDQLVQDHAREKERLEAEIAAQRAAWEEESRNAERERKEQEENPEEGARAGNRGIRIQEEPGAQEGAGQVRGGSAAAGKEEQGAAGSARKELAAARNRVEGTGAGVAAAAQGSAGIPRDREDGIREGGGAGGKAAEQKFEQEILLLKKEAETEKRLSSLQVKTLEETIARQAAQIDALQKQVDEAKQQVQDIAVKAIEGASGAKALAHINQIAMEQAKRPQQ